MYLEIHLVRCYFADVQCAREVLEELNAYTGVVCCCRIWSKKLSSAEYFSTEMEPARVWFFPKKHLSVSMFLFKKSRKLPCRIGEPGHMAPLLSPFDSWTCFSECIIGRCSVKKGISENSGPRIRRWNRTRSFKSGTSGLLFVKLSMIWSNSNFEKLCCSITRERFGWVFFIIFCPSMAFRMSFIMWRPSSCLCHTILEIWP